MASNFHHPALANANRNYVWDPNTLDWVAQEAAGGGGEGAILDGVSASIKATVLDLATSNPLAVSVRDANGDLASLGGGTQYTEDAAAAADPVGTAPILVRKDTPAAEVTTDGDNIAQRGTNFGAAYVTLLDSAGSPVSVGGGTQYTEDVASAADPIGTQLIARRRDAPAAETTTDGDVTALNSTSKGELYVKHIDAIPVTGTFWQATQPVSLATLPALVAGAANIGDVDVLTVPAPLSTTGGGTEATALRVTLANDSTGLVSIDDGGGIITVDGTVALGAGAVNIGDVDVLTVNGVAPAFGTGVRGATVQRVTIATDDIVPASQSGTWTVQPGNTANTTAWLVKKIRSSVGTQSNVASSATDVTILAANANRLGGSVHNDSTQILYLLLSNATSSATVYTVQMAANSHYEIPFEYTGVLKGLWASANGAARVTEFTV